MRFIVFMQGEPPERGNWCLESIRYHHPGAMIIHASDQATPMLDGADLVWRATDSDPMRLRLLHLCNLGDEPTVSIDTDTLTCAPLDEIWHKKFEVALTTRPHDTTSYNCGVMFSRCGEFWRAFYAYMADKWGTFTATEQNMPEFAKGWAVAKVPSDVWNCWTFKKGRVGTAKILHFKGQRKVHMRDYYERGVWRGN